jgi:hypothetical protein
MERRRARIPPASGVQRIILLGAITKRKQKSNGNRYQGGIDLAFLSQLEIFPCIITF